MEAVGTEGNVTSVSKKKSERRTPLDADDLRLLATLAKFPAMWPGSPEDAAKLERLAADGYLIQDPKLKVATYRLTISGWAALRDAKPKPRDAETKEPE